MPFDDGLIDLLLDALAESPAGREKLRRHAAHATNPPSEQLATLLQASIVCCRSKKTMERLKRSDDGFPKPVNPDASRGQPHLYRWPDLREFMSRYLGMPLPESLPTLDD